MYAHNIGDVRGKGLMIGVEIVLNRESRKPDPSMAEDICYRLKEKYIIMANDGPDKNVLIMTPPMCFTYENAHRIIMALDKILKEIEPKIVESSSSSNSNIMGQNRQDYT